MRWFQLSLCVLLWLLTACGAVVEPPIQSTLQVATPDLDSFTSDELCLEVAREDLPGQRRVEVLETLSVRGTGCDDLGDLASELYLAYVALGLFYEEQNNVELARRAYVNALRYPLADTRAADGLQRLRNVEPEIAGQPPSCDEATVIAANQVLDPYTPTQTPYVPENWRIRGVIYQPRAFPGNDWLSQVDLSMIREELDLIANSGLNTIRIYLDYSVLFQCPGNGAVPIPEAIRSIDVLLHEAAARNLRIALVLNHNPDLTTYPLYQQAPHTQLQTQWLVQRYTDESLIVLWDVREGGDDDYEVFGQEVVLQWLTDTVRLVRSETSQQITATWGTDTLDTAPLVDVVSFRQSGNVYDIRQDIAILRASTERPILLGWVGYPTIDGDEIAQRDQLYDVLQASENNDLYGWMVYRAFDHPLTGCEGITCDRYGLWNVASFPKLALDAVSNTINPTP